MIPQRQLVIASRLLKLRLQYKAIANPLKIVSVDPAAIKHFGRIGSTWESVAKVTDGEWDQEVSELNFRWGRKRLEWVSRDLQSLPKPQAIRKRFVDQQAWEETGIYEFYEHMIARHGRFDGCTHREDIKDRLSSIDRLYQSMKQDGYDPSHHKTLAPKWWKKSHLSAMDFPRVNIGRNGEFLFTGGAWHRLTIAQILGIDEIPCWVLCRHADWQKKREAIRSTNGTVDGIAESHPDLQDVI